MDNGGLNGRYETFSVDGWIFRLLSRTSAQEMGQVTAAAMNMQI